MLYFRYNTYSEALNFCNIINVGEGIPETPTSTTQNYCLPIECELKFYVLADQVTSKYTTATPVPMPIQPFPTI
jgi:hypothetical protein